MGCAAQTAAHAAPMARIRAPAERPSGGCAARARRVQRLPAAMSSDDVLRRIAAAIEARKRANPSDSYVASLFAKGHDAILKKIGEEATESVMAAKDGDKLKLTSEIADLFFHCLVVLAQHDLGPDDV